MPQQKFGCEQLFVGRRGAGICGSGWTDLGEFPIAGFAKVERVYGLADETGAG